MQGLNLSLKLTTSARKWIRALMRGDQSESDFTQRIMKRQPDAQVVKLRLFNF
jgi:hypothetical protein